MVANTVQSRKAKKPLQGLYKHASNAEEFLNTRHEKVASGCWEWTKSCDRYGYGQVSSSRMFRMYKKRRAHSLAYLAWKGEINDLCVLHTCDNRKCINPEHLFLGTHGDNNKDMVAKKRHRPPKGEEGNHKLTEKEVIEIRSLEGMETCMVVADRYNISYSSVCMIWRRETWRHV